MKELAIFLLMSVSLSAQAATRSVILTWTASTSTTVTGYSVYRCTVVSPATTCTPNVSGTAIGTSTGTSYTDSAATGSAYGYSVVANAPACTGSTPVTSPCGTSAPASTTVPVPPQTAGATNVIVVVP